MVVDYEQAWVRLQALVAEKTQHGREGLLRDMARIAEECRVPAGELARLLRLYGVEVERARSIQHGPADSVSSDGDGVPVGMAGSRDIIGQSHEGGHDVGSSRREAVAV